MAADGGVDRLLQRGGLRRWGGWASRVSPGVERHPKAAHGSAAAPRVEPRLGGDDVDGARPAIGRAAWRSVAVTVTGSIRATLRGSK